MTTGQQIFAPEGRLTIGFGRNIQDVGIAVSEAEHLLENDLNRAIFLCEANLRVFPQLDEVRQAAVVEMAFNLGIGKLLGFQKMLAALEREDYERAAIEALDSLWAKQVGRRALEIAEMIRSGRYV